ncbi:hypothetical protein V8F33_000701 [Rhypophila sp. PSN 637]
MDIPTRVYRTFNDEIFGRPEVLTRPGDSQFERFGNLPTELRLLVWKKCLPESTGRLVSLLVAHSGQAPVQDEELFTVKNGLENVVSGYPYLLIGSQDHGQSCNALSQVNKEAREVLLAKYRLPIEICTVHGDRPYRFSTLRVDPDNDMVELTRIPSTTFSKGLKGVKASVLLYVLHDMLANDPRGQGIAQLAMGADCNDVAHLAALQKEGIHPVVLESISKYFSTHLKTFYSVIAPSSEARIMLGPFSFLRGPYHNNRSVPITHNHGVQRTVEFTLLAQDPRPIETDLPHVAVGTDPRMNVYLFYHVLAKFGIPDPAPPMQIRYMMGIQLRAWANYERHNHIVLTRAKFVDDLRTLDQNLIKGMEQFAPKHMPSYGQVFASEEEYERSLRGLADVSGLWVFGSDTFGDIGYDLTKEVPDSDVHWRRTGTGYSPYKPKMVVDLSKGKRPGLMVFRFVGAGDGT